MYYQFYLNKRLNLFFLQVIVPGKGENSRPLSGDTVTIRLAGQLEDGTKVDCQEECQFILNDGDVIMGMFILLFHKRYRFS